MGKQEEKKWNKKKKIIKEEKKGLNKKRQIRYKGDGNEDEENMENKYLCVCYV
jgi:hypothetical protein